MYHPYLSRSEDLLAQTENSFILTYAGNYIPKFINNIQKWSQILTTW